MYETVSPRLDESYTVMKTCDRVIRIRDIELTVAPGSPQRSPRSLVSMPRARSTVCPCRDTSGRLRCRSSGWYLRRFCFGSHYFVTSASLENRPVVFVKHTEWIGSCSAVRF